MSRLRLSAAALLLLAPSGCGGGSAALSPAAAAPTWVKHSFHRNPDAVVAVDVAAMRRDPLFGALLARGMDEVHGARSLATVSQVDFFATTPIFRPTWMAVVYGTGDPPSELFGHAVDAGAAARGPVVVDDHRGSEVWLSARPGVWVLGSERPTEQGAPDRVSLDGNALLEAWFGPRALAEGIDRGRPELRETWGGAMEARFIVEGGDTPSIHTTVRFDTNDGAAHAAARVKVDLDRVLDGSEFAKRLLALIGDFKVGASGDQLDVQVRFTHAFTELVLQSIGAGGKPAP